MALTWEVFVSVMSSRLAWVFLPVLGANSTACTGIADSLASDEGEPCVSETTEITDSNTFKSAKTGETIDIGARLAVLEGIRTGTVNWLVPDRDAEFTLSVERITSEPVTVYYECGHYLGLNIPTHIDIATSDGALEESFTGIIGLDEADSLLASEGDWLTIPPERVTQRDIFPSGHIPTSAGGWSVYVGLNTTGGALPFSGAEVVLRQWNQSATPLSRVVIGQVTLPSST
jgi:hypothetical protein